MWGVWRSSLVWITESSVAFRVHVARSIVVFIKWYNCWRLKRLQNTVLSRAMVCDPTHYGSHMWANCNLFICTALPLYVRLSFIFLLNTIMQHVISEQQRLACEIAMQVLRSKSRTYLPLLILHIMNFNNKLQLFNYKNETQFHGCSLALPRNVF